MSLLNERLLLEEDGFEDATEPTEIDQDSTAIEDSTDDETYEATSTVTYKVSFVFGKHENWSRVDASSKDDAERIVREYVTRKWPDREFEVTEVDEFNEDDVEESLNESLAENIQGMGKYSDKFYDYYSYLNHNNLTGDAWYLISQLIRYCKEEDLKDLWTDRMESVAKKAGFKDKDELDESLTDAQPIENGAAVGMATIISDLIKDEYEAIDGYNSAIATAQSEGFEDMVNVLSEIQAEENLHIGQLQTLMNTVDPNAHLVDDGKQEGIEQLANPLGSAVVEESLTSLTEDLDDMSLQDQRMFIRCVNEIWNMSVLEWTQKYYDGQLEVVNVNSYSDIPNTSNLIDISSSDISQGTGNVVVYTCMDAGDGTLYRYADF